MTKQEILKEIEEEVEPFTKDHNKVRMLFSKDEAERAMAHINMAIQRMKYLCSADDVKNVVLDHENPYFRKPQFGQKPGSLVAVRPVLKEYENKTYIGFLIGEISTGCSLEIKDDTLTVKVGGVGNPAIFIPQTGTVVMGFESWWSEIETEAELRQITDADIENTWYVKLWKELHPEKPINDEKKIPDSKGTTGSGS